VKGIGLQNKFQNPVKEHSGQNPRKGIHPLKSTIFAPQSKTKMDSGDQITRAK
jgi:hypothetical protein